MKKDMTNYTQKKPYVYLLLAYLYLENLVDRTKIVDIEKQNKEKK